jgi:hypothetical protein
MSPQLKVQGAPIQFAPKEFASQLDDWIESGILPDRDQPNNRLLRAILCNDLSLVIALATATQQWPLVIDTMRWLWNFAPPQSYGSRRIVATWELMGAREWLV